MFKKYPDEAREPLKKLYQLMLVGKLNEKQKREKSTLRRQLRDMGMLSLPFSLNRKRFQLLQEK